MASVLAFLSKSAVKASACPSAAARCIGVCSYKGKVSDFHYVISHQVGTMESYLIFGWTIAPFYASNINSIKNATLILHFFKDIFVLLTCLSLTSTCAPASSKATKVLDMPFQAAKCKGV